MRLSAPFLNLSERTLQHPRRDKLFFSHDATTISSFWILQPQREHAWGFRGPSGRGGKYGSEAPVPSSKMAPSGPAQKAGREAAAATGFRVVGPGAAELAE